MYVCFMALLFLKKTVRLFCKVSAKFCSFYNPQVLKKKSCAFAQPYQVLKLCIFTSWAIEAA